jgi:hypothetical protein
MNADIDVDVPWSWGLFAGFVFGFLIWCLAVYGAWVLVCPPKCELGVGALL